MLEAHVQGQAKNRSNPAPSAPSPSVLGFSFHFTNPFVYLPIFIIAWIHDRHKSEIVDLRDLSKTGSTNDGAARWAFLTLPFINYVTTDSCRSVRLCGSRWAVLLIASTSTVFTRFCYFVLTFYLQNTLGWRSIRILHQWCFRPLFYDLGCLACGNCGVERPS